MAPIVRLVCVAGAPAPIARAVTDGSGADVWLVDGRLLVVHDREAIRSDRRLESLYLGPLRERTKR